MLGNAIRIGHAIATFVSSASVYLGRIDPRVAITLLALLALQPGALARTTNETIKAVTLQRPCCRGLFVSPQTGLFLASVLRFLIARFGCLCSRFPVLFINGCCAGKANASYE